MGVGKAVSHSWLPCSVDALPASLLFGFDGVVRSTTGFFFFFFK